MEAIPAPLVGGLLLSFATSLALLDQGKILGCSGIAHSTTNHLVSTFSTVNPTTPGNESKGGTDGWKSASFLGLVAGGFALGQLRSSMELFVGQPVLDAPTTGLMRPLLAGLAVGLGTKLSKGCTSGHMLIGMARFSKRSISATFTFFPAAILTARLFSYPLPPMSASVAHLNLSYLTPSISALFLIPFASSLFVHRILPSRIAALVQSFSLSFLFSLGLALTGMLRPSKVLSFFYLPISAPFPTSSYPLPPWDPSLALVAIGGLVPNIFAWRYLIKDRTMPRKRDKSDVPTGGKVDGKLIIGSAMFGIGWGLMGVCPGPMLSVAGSGSGGQSLSLFAAAFAVGGYLVNYL